MVRLPVQAQVCKIFFRIYSCNTNLFKIQVSFHNLACILRTYSYLFVMPAAVQTSGATVSSIEVSLFVCFFFFFSLNLIEVSEYCYPGYEFL